MTNNNNQITNCELINPKTFPLHEIFLNFMKPIQTPYIKKASELEQTHIWFLPQDLWAASSLLYRLSDHIILTFIYLSLPRLKPVDVD